MYSPKYNSGILWYRTAAPHLSNMKIFLKVHIILSLIFLTALNVSGQIKLHGKVIDAEDAPLEFVTVRISGTAIGTHTGLDGTFKLSCPPPANDTLVVIFSCIGYDELKRTLIDPKGDLALNVRMRSKDHELREIQVTDFRKQTNQMQTIDTESYKLAADATGGSVESMLTTLAGVNSNNEMSSQYSVRGGSYDENSVYINGIEVYRPQLVSSGQQEGLSVVNPDMVGSVSFSTGGFGVEYGDKMSSALDITYREPESFEGSVSGSLMGASAALGQSSKKFSQLHGIRYKRNSSLLSSLETKGEYDPNFLDYQTNLVFRFNNKWKASFLGNIAVNNYKFRPVNRETNFGTSTDAKQFKVYFDGQEKDRFETYFGALNLSYNHSKSTSFSLLASGYLTNELVAYDISGEYWLDQAGTSGGTIGGELGVGRYRDHARNRLKSHIINAAMRGITAIKSHSLTYGIAIKSLRMEEKSSEWEQRDSAGYSLPLLPDILSVFYSSKSDNSLNTLQTSAYIQDNLRLSGDFGYINASAGIRATYTGFNNEFIVSPRLQIGYVPSANTRWAFRFSTGLYHQTPFFKEIRKATEISSGEYVIELNKNIRSQRSLQFIFGSDFTFKALGRPFKLSAEAYYKALANVIPYEINNLKITYSGINESKGHIAGLDFKLFGQFVPGSDSWLSIGVLDSKEKLRGVSVPGPNDRRYNISLFFTDFFPKIPGLKVSLRGIFMDGLPQSSPHSTRDKGYFRTPPYKRVDIGAAYGLLTENRSARILPWIKSAWIGVDCFNLFDISNVGNYYWVSDVNNIEYAVPNYLTRRMLNLKLTLDF